jgi:hypothetical protein
MLMKKYEYKEFTVDTKGIVYAKIGDAFINQLNELGKDGWKLVQALPMAQSYGRTSSVTFILRKEII